MKQTPPPYLPPHDLLRGKTMLMTAAAGAADYGAGVNAVAPSLVVHPFLVNTKPQELIDELEAEEAFGRGAAPWEVSNVMVFLASDYSSQMTGEVVAVSSRQA